MLFIYVLKLKNNNFFVGSTNCMTHTMHTHMNGTASAWTKLHKPLLLVKQVECIRGLNPTLQEDLYVKQLMLDHGIDKVRGGSYLGVELSTPEKSSLLKEIWFADRCCCKCGRRSHVTKNCAAIVDVLGNKIVTAVRETTDDNFETSRDIWDEYNIVARAMLQSDQVDKRVKDCINATKNVIEISQMKATKIKLETDQHSRKTSIVTPTSTNDTSIGDTKSSESDSSSDISSIRTIDASNDNVQGIFRRIGDAQIISPCTRCGRISHHRSNCYERFDIHGFDISDCF